MGGLSEKTPNDEAFAVVVEISLLSLILVIPLLFCYLAVVVAKLASRRRERLVKNAK